MKGSDTIKCPECDGIGTVERTLRGNEGIRPTCAGLKAITIKELHLTVMRLNKEVSEKEHRYKYLFQHLKPYDD